jgi:outer membrane usher protein
MLTPENITAVNGYRIQTLACHPREAGTPSETSTNQEAAS